MSYSSGMEVKLPSIEIDRIHGIIKVYDNDIGTLYISVLECPLSKSIDETIDYYQRFIPKDCFMAVAPYGSIVSQHVLGLATIYAHKLMKRGRSKIRRLPLLLLSILYCKRQINEIIELLETYAAYSTKLYLIIICRTPQECLIENCNPVSDIKPLHELLARIYGIEDIPPDHIEDYVISKISGFVVKLFY